MNWFCQESEVLFWRFQPRNLVDSKRKCINAALYFMLQHLQHKLQDVVHKLQGLVHMLQHLQHKK